MNSKNQFYRNIESLEVEGQTIDEGSLWELKEDLLILVDDDQYVSWLYDPQIFRQES